MIEKEEFEIRRAEWLRQYKEDQMQKRVGELEQEVTKLTLLINRLHSDLFEHPWKKSGHPWNQVRNPRHLPK